MEDAKKHGQSSCNMLGYIGGGIVIFYEIQLNSIPHIQFACDVTVENYHNTFHRRHNFLEVTIGIEGQICRHYTDGSMELCLPDMLGVVTQLSNYRTDAVNGKRQRHITVGVKADYDCVKRDTQCCHDVERIKREIVQNGLILVPDRVLLNEFHDKAMALFRGLVRSFSSENPRRTPHAMGYWYRLVAVLTEYVLNEIEQESSSLSPAALDYVEKAKRYIEEQYTQQIRVEDIANELAISAGYLHDIFKKATGLGVLEFINAHRVNLVKQYVKNQQLTLREAGLMVGVEDPAYMSRLFKKTTGLSFREYFSEHMKK